MTEPRRPPPHWTRAPSRPGVPLAHEAWTYGGLMALSSLGEMEAPDGSHDVIPTWLVSVSKNGRRCSDADLARARRAFGMDDAEEDNHHPGVARHLFLTVDPARRVACECKAGDAVHVEPDGYRYSEKPGECAGCELAAATGRPCARHPAPIRL